MWNEKAIQCDYQAKKKSLIKAENGNNFIMKQLKLVEYHSEEIWQKEARSFSSPF